MARPRDNDAVIRVHRLVDGAVETSEGVEALARPGAWIEVVQPDAAETQALVERTGLHELAVEDALTEGHPPKLEEFEDQVFLIAHTPVEEDGGETRKIALFLTKDRVVSILRMPLPAVDEVAARVPRRAAHFLGTPAFLAHALLDHLTDGFEAAVDGMLDEAEAIDDQDPEPSVMCHIGDLRTAAAHLGRIVRSQRDVFHSLQRIAHPALPKKVQPYLRDVYDHVLRVHDLLDVLRDMLGAARDAHLAAVNNRLSDIMRVLTVIATIMMPLSLLAGLYGMNFEWMPGLRHPAGFWILLGVMLAVAGGMLAFFRHRRWL